MKDHSSPIGIFDSGVGGLTVFRAIRRLLPNESLLYVGDTARVPYGNKTAETVTGYSLQIANWLAAQGAKMVVVACNTASSVALPALQQTLRVPVVGMIDPGARAAVQKSRSQKIGVVGTTRTVASAAYDAAIHRLAPNATVVSQACPLFVSLVEEGWLDGPITESIAQNYLGQLTRQNVDTVILGCTHYPLLIPVIRKCLGPSVTLIDSGEAAAVTVMEQLTAENLLAAASQHPTLHCAVTDMPAPFHDVAQRFLDDPLPQIHHVQLE